MGNLTSSTEPGPPRFVVVAGPNGSGKTSLLAKGLRFEVVNSDEIARGLARADTQAAAAEAWVLAGEQVERNLAMGVSFGIETTLALQSDLALMQRARRSGFQVSLAAIWSGALEVSLERVRLLVARQGHDVPEAEIRMRYEAGLEALGPAIRAADIANVFDNSRPDNDGPGLVLEASCGSITALLDRPPNWLQAAFSRWQAPLVLYEDLRPLAENPRTYRAEQLIEMRRRSRTSPPNGV